MLKITVGGLESIPSVYFKISPYLKEFNQSWYSGRVPAVEWDLRGISYGKINVAAASFFLALAHRVRQYSNGPQKILIDYHPKIFSYLTGINFFEISEEYNLFLWPYNIGGFSDPDINPHTQIISLEQMSNRPDIFNHIELADWKRIHREDFREFLVTNCNELFRFVNIPNIESNLPLVVSRICAEIAINSLLWGEATSFLGMQRNRNLIGVSVIDIGKGFRHSFREKQMHSSILNKVEEKDADLYACILASVTNEKNFGLKRAIDNVVNVGGNISISSGTSEVNWGLELWEKFNLNVNENGIEKAIKDIAKPIYKADKDLKKSGYVRVWNSSIRGVRVSFNMPIKGGEL